MKGFTKYLVGFLVVIVIFVVVDYVLASSLNRECDFSDYTSKAYNLINKIEFAKLNAKQALKFSFEKTLSDMSITLDDLKNDDSLRQTFLENLNENFNPQPLDSSITTEKISLDFNSDLTKIIAKVRFSGSSLDFSATIVSDITYEIG
jgi:hypothetical protein